MCMWNSLNHTHAYQEQVIGFEVMKPGREFIREGVVDVIDARPHKRYALLFSDVLLLVRPKGKSFKTIRAIPVRKALYQFGEDMLQILFDYNQLARLRFNSQVRQMWYKTLKVRLAILCGCACPCGCHRS